MGLGDILLGSGLAQVARHELDGEISDGQKMICRKSHVGSDLVLLRKGFAAMPSPLKAVLRSLLSFRWWMSLAAMTTFLALTDYPGLEFSRWGLHNLGWHRGNQYNHGYLQNAKTLSRLLR